MRKASVSIIAIILLSAVSRLNSAYGQTISQLSTTYSTDILDEIIPLPTSFHPCPTAKEDYWIKHISREVRDDYVRCGEYYMTHSQWEPIPDRLFAEYKRSGARAHYEQQNYIKRRQLACLVMAETMQQQKKYIPSIITGLDYFCQEKWWGLPAHYQDSIAHTDLQTVDLYNAETAALIAWTIYMLSDAIDQERPGMSDIMRKEIDRRMLTPALNDDNHWKKVTNNWNPWICSNWLTCVLLCEKERTRQLEAIHQILRCMDLFYNHYAADGACEEGVTYWSRAAASLFDCAYLLDIATQGRITMAHNSRLALMGQFVYTMHIAGNQFVNYADSHQNTLLNAHNVYSFGHYIGDNTMMDFSRYMAQQYDGLSHPVKLFNTTYPELGRTLLFMQLYDEFSVRKPSAPIVPDNWLPTLQIATFRTKAKEKSPQWFVSAKGGNNGDSHNHNDIGNFIVYADGQPVIIDIGAASYTAQTFSSERYKLFNTRSAFHNVPIINGQEQSAGKEFKARKVKYKSGSSQRSLSLDLSSAYPATADVREWKRTISINKDQEIQITDSYQLNEYRSPSAITYITCGEAKKISDGDIAIDTGNHTYHLKYAPDNSKVQIEPIIHNDPIVSNAWQQKPLYKVVIYILSHSLKGKIVSTLTP